MYKVLITTESIAGAGHLQAAQSLMQAFALVDQENEVKVVSTLSIVSPALESVSRAAYMNTLNKAPKVWGWAYEKENIWSALFKNALGQCLSFRLSTLLKKEQPDAVICTHAFCLSGIAQLKRKQENTFVLGAAITDFDVNGFWVHEEVDFYIVAHDDVKRKLVTKYGVKDEKVHVTGIPISPQFTPLPKRNRESLALHPDLPTILVMGGGTGWGPIEEMLDAIESIKKKMQIVVISGNNTSLKLRLQERVDKSRHKLIVQGYVTNMAEWMAASDIAITKPGGLTASEALASGLPMVIYQAIPGQEQRNTRFLIDKNIAFQTENSEHLTSIIENHIFRDDQILELLRKRAKKLGKPDSSIQAALIALNEIKNNQHVDVGRFETVQ